MKNDSICLLFVFCVLLLIGCSTNDNPEPQSFTPWIETGSDRLTLLGLDEFIVNTIAADPSNSERLYVSTSNGIFRSDNSGENWVLLTASIGGPALKIDPRNPNNIFAGRVFSRDGGNTWERTTENLVDPDPEAFPYIFSVVFPYADGGFDSTWTFIALTSGPFGGGLYYSTDDRQNWITSLSRYRFHAFFQHSTIQNTFFVNIWDGFHVSTDATQNWVEVGSASFYNFANPIAYGNTIYYPNYEHGVSVSPDNGLTWEHISTGLDTVHTEVFSRFYVINLIADQSLVACIAQDSERNAVLYYYHSGRWDEIQVVAPYQEYSPYDLSLVKVDDYVLVGAQGLYAIKLP